MTKTNEEEHTDYLKARIEALTAENERLSNQLKLLQNEQRILGE